MTEHIAQLPNAQPALRVMPMPADANQYGDIFGGSVSYTHLDVYKRQAVTYPAVAGAFSDADIAAALIAAHLPKLAESLDARDIWSQRLAGGEQQRLAIARAMLAKPAWLFLDEATAAMDEKMESAIYVLLAEKLPNTTIVSIGHRSTLIQYHAARVDMVPKDDGTFTPKLV